MKIDIIPAVKGKLPRQRIKKLSRLIEDKEAAPAATISIIFIDDREIKKLNKKFRGKNKATDVLSFNYDDESGDDTVWGEIYISLETAKRQAREMGEALDDEILRLCCHGLLHLLGYDHKRRSDEAVMRLKESHYLGRLMGC
jgi:probable rRNA maturation factor